MSDLATLETAAAGVRPPAGDIELSVIAPTFNERANAPRLLGLLSATLEGVRWEVIFVDDDSPDGTSNLVKEMARTDPRVRCLRRVGRRGLAGAITEGFLASAAPFVAVLDADMQHDETVLPRMLEALRSGDWDVASGSRYLLANGPDEGLSPIRKWGSQVATAVARRATGVAATDPMGGFFMIRREAVEAVAPKLSPAGFKLLFDILVCHRPPLRVKDFAYQFKNRSAGESKMDGRVVLEYAGLLAARLSGDLVSPNFIFYALVGGCGLLAQMLTLALDQPLGFGRAQALAAFVGATAAFLTGQAAAYRARRRKGLRLLGAYLRFALLALFGGAPAVALALQLHAGGASWPLAGVAAAVCGAVWNAVAERLAV